MKNHEQTPRDKALGEFLRMARVASEETEAPVLSVERRRAVLDAAMRPRRRFSLPVLAPRKGWALAAATAAVAVLLVPVALRPHAAPAPAQVVPATAPTGVEGLQVTSEGGKVVLRWETQGKPIRVIRATTPDPAAVGSEAIIEGNSWTDPQPSAAQVVFYRVEALEG